MSHNPTVVPLMVRTLTGLAIIRGVVIHAKVDCMKASNNTINENRVRSIAVDAVKRNRKEKKRRERFNRGMGRGWSVPKRAQRERRLCLLLTSARHSSPPQNLHSAGPRITIGVSEKSCWKYNNETIFQTKVSECREGRTHGTS